MCSDPTGMRSTSTPRPLPWETIPSEFLIIFTGVNHAATGKATYSNFALYGADILNGVGCVNNQNLSGTAVEYLPGNPRVQVSLRLEGGAKLQRRSTMPRNTLRGRQGLRHRADQPAFVGFRGYLRQTKRWDRATNEILYNKSDQVRPKNSPLSKQAEGSPDMPSLHYLE